MSARSVAHEARAHRQSRRDSGADPPGLSGRESRSGRGVLDRGPRRAPSRTGRPRGVHRPAVRGAELPEGRCPARHRARHRVRRGAPGLRVHGGERGIRSALRRARPHVHRPVSRGHRADGRQDRGARRRAIANGRPRGARIGCEHRRRRRREARGRPHRLSAAAQGERGRRRARHAGGERPVRARVATRRGRRRGGGRVLGLAPLHGALLPAGPPRRGPGLRRSARQPRPPRRARLQRAAPAPEARGGVAFAGAVSGAAGRNLRRSGPPGAGCGLRERGHRRVHLRSGRGALLLHRDEHPHPGRAPGDRDGDRHRSGAGAASRRGRRAAFVLRRNPSSTAVTPSNGASTRRTPSAGSSRLRAGSPGGRLHPRVRTCASTPSCGRVRP